MPLYKPATTPYDQISDTTGIKNEGSDSLRLDNLGLSIPINDQSGNHPMTHRFDKLSVVGNVENIHLEDLYDMLRRLKSDDFYCIRHGKTTCQHIKELYCYQVVINSRINKKQVLVIYYKPTKKDFKAANGYEGRGAIRLEISPQHFLAEDITKLIVYLGKKNRLGKHIYQFMKKAWITRIDYALDIYSMRLSDCHIGFKASRDGKHYPNNGELQGLRLGSPESEYHMACYEKLDVGDDLESLKALDDEKLEMIISNWCDNKDYRQFLRLEVRYKPKGKKLLLRELHNLHNLLERIQFYRKPLMIKGLDLNYEELLSRLTLPELRIYIQDTNPYNAKSLLKQLDNSLKNNRVDVFNKDEIWCGLHLLIGKLGILGKPQYWGAENRKKWLLKQRIHTRGSVIPRRMII
ncbi:hypothetical protein [Klebsiella sp. BIGb0407]|uniref:hypothetical protein n=1 Tax=Klebsiella sp. BIGb0407 TaxID=2940603 RepID=UPI002168D5A8|nr:hypothetical protein [Klebsiella sp. BIGb0407]MCS3434034.1 hypothetical protein [Klebsiella sp. BIGb0407]